MKIYRAISFILLIIICLSADDILFAQLKGSFIYEEFQGLERSVSVNPCVRIKSICPNLKFDWSGGKPKVFKKDGEWIIWLKPGLQTLYISAKNYESLDIKLDLRKYEVKTIRIIPIIKQFYLKIETEPDSALVILKETKGNKIVKGISPFEYYPTLGKYNLYISGIEYKSIDTTIVFDSSPITKLKFNLNRIKKDFKNIINSTIIKDTLMTINFDQADNFNIKKNKTKIEKYLKIAGMITITAWLTSDILFNQSKNRKEKPLPIPLPLPGVPGFPKH